MEFVLPAIFKAVDKFSAPIAGMGKSIDSLADRAHADAARMERSLRRVHDAAMNIAEKTAIAGAAILAPLVLATKAAEDFQVKMSNVATLVDTSKESMVAMGDEVLKIAQRTPVAIDDLTQALYQIRSAGIPAAKAMEVLEQSARLSVAGLSTATEATNAMTSALNVFKNENLSANEIADIFFKTVAAGKTTMSQLNEAFGSTAPIVNAAGVKFKDFQAATAALTLTGLQASEAQHEIMGSVVSLLKPTGEMQKIFHELHVKTGKELIDKMHGLGGAFKAVETAGTKAGINLAKAWGRKEAFTAVTLLNGSQNNAYVKNLEDMSNGINKVDEAFNKQMETSKAHSQLAKNNLEALSITIGEKLLPIVDKLIDRVVPIIQHFTEWIHTHEKLATVIVVSTAAIGSLLLGIATVSGIIGIVTKATWLWQAAQWVLNIALDANPIGLLILGIAALVAGIVILVKHVKGWGAQWDEITHWMGAVWKAVSLGLQLEWLVLKNTFLTMVDAMVLAWKWGQNMIGNLSDAQYEKDKARIKQEMKMPVDNIKATAIAAANAAGDIKVPAWKLQWDNEQSKTEDNKEQDKSANSSVDPKLIEHYQKTSGTQNNTNHTAEITVKATNGTHAAVTKNSGIPIKLTPTVGQFQ